MTELYAVVDDKVVIKVDEEMLARGLKDTDSIDYEAARVTLIHSLIAMFGDKIAFIGVDITGVRGIANFVIAPTTPTSATVETLFEEGK